MSYFKPSKWIDVLWHVLTIIGIFVIVLLGIFKWFLPSYTHHGEVIYVPSLENKTMEEVIKTLDEYDLRYVITDTVYSPNHEANCVVTQTPKAQAEVKEGRKIYLTLNQSGRPKWLFKEGFIELLRKRSLSEVKYRLDSINVAYKLTYIYAENVKNYVHEVYYGGDTLRGGTSVEIGGSDRVVLQVSTGEANPNQVEEEEEISDDELLLEEIDDIVLDPIEDEF